MRGLRRRGTGGEPARPRCACAAVYARKARRAFKRRARLRQSSVTSGTIFRSRKLPFRDVLVAIALFVNAARGKSALELGRGLDVSHKTACVPSRKLREAMAAGNATGAARGTVEVDGACFGGRVKPASGRENRRGRRLAENQARKRRVVVVVRERGGKAYPFVVRAEDEGVAAVAERVEPGGTIHADEASHWDGLEARFETKRINHGLACSDGEACTNQAESFLSRPRRAEIGQRHHISGPYLRFYAGEMAWREDNRRWDTGAPGELAGVAALAHAKSRNWRGYWQRRLTPLDGQEQIRNMPIPRRFRRLASGA